MPCFKTPNIIHVLCAVTVCFLSGSYALPVVFPSFTTKGFAYIKEANELVTVPAAFGHLLCSPSGESVDFAAAKKPCSRIVFFTSRNSVTFEFLNLSSNGVVQPIASTPQVMSSHQVLNLCWNVPNDPDESGTCRTHETETPRSAPAEDEESNEGQFRTLKQDGSSAARPLAADSVPPDVQEANQTSGFLDSSGAVVATFNFVVELHLEGLPEQELISLEFGFDNNITRSLLIYVDTRPVSVDIKHNEAAKKDHDTERVRYELDVIFSTRIVSRANEGDFSCMGVTRPLNSLIDAAQFSGGRHNLTANHLLAVLDAAEKQSTCPKPPGELNETTCVSLDGVNATFNSNKTGLDVCGFTNRRTPWTTVLTAELFLEKGQTRNVSVTVNGNAVVSLFGMPVPTNKTTFNLEDRTNVSTWSTKNSSTFEQNEDSVAAMRMLGKTISGLTGAFVGLSSLVSLGVPFLAPAGAPALMSDSGCLSNVVDLMQIGQRVYLMTKLAVPNLPRNFIAFGEQFAWTMLDFRYPWDASAHSDDESDTAHSGRRSLLDDDTATKDVDIDDDPYSKLRGTYFWTGISMASACVLHLVLMVIFVAFKGCVPVVLRVPRLELYLSHTFIAIVAEGPAYLFSGNTRQIFIGILVLAVGVIPLSVFYLLVLGRYVFHDDGGQEKRIVYGIGLIYNSESTDGSVTEPLIQSTNETMPSERIEDKVGLHWCLKHILLFFFGRPYRGGKWTWKRGDASRVIDRYGPIFEDYRGKPMRQTGLTQQANENGTNMRLKQFEAVEDSYRYSVDVCETSFVLRITEKAICLMTQVFITVLILGEDDPVSNYQAALILAIHCFYLLYLRIFRPHCSRYKLGVAMFEKSLDAFSLLLVVWKLNGDRTSTHENIGTIMTVVEVTEIAIQLIDMVVTLWPVFKEVKKVFWDRMILGKKQSSPQESTDDLDEDGFEERFYRNSARFLDRNVGQRVNVFYQTVRGERRQSGIHHDENQVAAQNGSAMTAHAETEPLTS